MVRLSLFPMYVFFTATAAAAAGTPRKYLLCNSYIYTITMYLSDIWRAYFYPSPARSLCLIMVYRNYNKEDEGGRLFRNTRVQDEGEVKAGFGVNDSAYRPPANSVSYVAFDRIPFRDQL